MQIPRKGPWRYVVFLISSALHSPDTAQASLQRGGGLEETETPEYRTFLGNDSSVAATRVGVDAERQPDGLRERKARCGSDQPRECNDGSDTRPN